MNLNRTHANIVLTTYEALSLKPPKAVTEAQQLREMLEARSGSLGAGVGELAAAVVAALADGREPASDPEVQRVTTAMALTNQGLSGAVAAAGLDAVTQACRANVDAIIAHWRKPFIAAADTLTQAHRRIGDLDLNDAPSILPKGGDIAEVWSRAQAAARTIDVVINGWSNLLSLTRSAPIQPQHRPLRLADMTLQDYRGLPSGIDAWGVIRAGLTLSLPSVEEYRGRVSAIETAATTPEMVIDEQRSAIAGRPIRVPALG